MESIRFYAQKQYEMNKNRRFYIKILEAKKWCVQAKKNEYKKISTPYNLKRIEIVIGFEMRLENI